MLLVSTAKRHDVIALDPTFFENSFDSFCCPPARSEGQSEGFTVVRNENKLAHWGAPAVFGIFRIGDQLPKNFKVVARMFSQDRQRRDSECRLVENVLSLVIFASYAANHLSEERLRTIVREHVLKVSAHLLTGVADSIDEAFVTLRMKDSMIHVSHVQHALGSVGRPMSDADLEAKFRDLAALGAPGVDAARLIDAVWSLDAAAEASTLARLAVPRAGPAAPRFATMSPKESRRRKKGAS